MNAAKINYPDFTLETLTVGSRDYVNVGHSPLPGLFQHVGFCEFASHLRSLPDRAKNDFVQIFPTLDEIAALRHNDDIPVFARELHICELALSDFD